jgi:hypothetical protein
MIHPEAQFMSTAHEDLAAFQQFALQKVNAFG